MTASSPDLSDRGDLRPLAELVATMHEAWADGRFLLVGAMARDLLLEYAHGIPAQRATEDIEFAFAVPDWRAYGELRDALIGGGRFAEMARVPHRLLFDGHRKVDLIPFGGVERPDGAIVWPPPQDSRMVVLGFREALDAAVQVQLPDGISVAVASLSAQAVLKLFAWSDRRYEQPGKDAGDFWLLLHHYLDAGNRERLYSEAVHLLEAEDYNDDLAGAWLMGFDARQLLMLGGHEDNIALAGAMALLAGETVDGPVQFASDMHTLDLQHAVDMLRACHAGLSGTRKTS